MNGFVAGSRKFGSGVLLTLLVASCSSKTDDAKLGAGGGAGGAQATSDGGRSTSGGSSGGAAPSGGAGRSASGAPSAAGSTTGSAGAAPSGDAGAAGSGAESPCAAAGLVWKSANKTNYESYPDPGSQECIEFNGCTWAGQFAGCDGKKPEAWVKTHDIVAAFPDFGSLALHDLCLRQGTKTIVVTVLDTCGDSDCNGCCTENKGDADELIDVEKYTNQRWGVDDGRIEWADLGPTRGNGCD